MGKWIDAPNLRPLSGGLVRAQDEELSIVLELLLLPLRSLLRPGIRRMRLHSLDDQVDRPVHAQSFRKIDSIQMRMSSIRHNIANVNLWMSYVYA